MEGDRQQTITVREVRQAANRALEYQRYVFRRAFAIYYLIWAAVIIVLASARVSAIDGAGAVVLAAAAVATGLFFGRARRVLILRRALGRAEEINKVYVYAWIAAVCALVIGANVFPAYAAVSTYAITLTVPILLYYLLGVVFPGRLPVEGLAAAAAYGTAAVLSLLVSLTGVYPWLAGWAWGATAVVWFGASFYALYRAPDELEALRG